MLFKEDVKGSIEAALFVSVEPLTIENLMKLLDMSNEDASDSLYELIEEYKQPGRGIEIIKIGEGFKLQTKRNYSFVVEKVVKPQETKLSKSILETLAIIAYKEPVTRGEIEAIKGVNIDYAIHKLLDKELVEVIGKRDTLGHPVIYGTTEKFLMFLGIESKDDLPKFEEVMEDEINFDDEAMIFEKYDEK